MNHFIFRAASKLKFLDFRVYTPLRKIETKRMTSAKKKNEEREAKNQKAVFVVVRVIVTFKRSLLSRCRMIHNVLTTFEIMSSFFVLYSKEMGGRPSQECGHV